VDVKVLLEVRKSDSQQLDSFFGLPLLHGGNGMVVQLNQLE
jgi:hypothetical protein